MRVLVALATLLGGVSAKATKEAVNLHKSGTGTELEVAQSASAAAKRDLFSARAEFDALVAEAQLPSGVQIPPGWVVVNTAAKTPSLPPVPVATPKVVQPPPMPRALVASPGTSNTNVVSSAPAKVVGNDQLSSAPPQASKLPAATPQASPQNTAPAKIPAAQPKQQLAAPAVPAAPIPRALPQQHQQQQKQQQKQERQPAPAPTPCWDPAPSPAGGPAASPAGAPGASAVTASADELSGPHAKTPEDDYVPALEGVLVPPAGEAAPVTSAQVVVPPNTLSKIQSVECLEKTLENPEYKCADHHYVGGAPPPQAAVQQEAKKETSGGASAADIEAINDAVKKAQNAAADAKAEAAMAEKYFNDAKTLAEKITKKEAAASSFLRHPTKKHHREHHEVSAPKHMPILIHAKSPVVIHDKKPQ